MRVLKRNQRLEDVAFDKVVRRIANFCSDLPALDPHTVAQKICSRIYDGVETSKLDELGAEICSSMMTEHPDYGTLAARIVISNHQKNTLPGFAATMELLAGNPSPIVSDALIAVVREHAAAIEAEIRHERDFLFDYFGFKTLERSYLLKVGGRIVERPQHMWMRVALGIHGADLATAFDTYRLMSTRMYTHATPTLFNAGTPRAGLSSCFLMGVHDSIDGIYKNLGDGARISKYSGGIGLHVHNIRGKDALIRGTNGHGNGIVPMLRVYNSTFRYVNQCFAPETLVASTQGWKRVDAVAVGDLLLTGDGYKPVLEVCARPLEAEAESQAGTGLAEVAIANGHRVAVTMEHVVFVLRGGQVIEVAVRDLRLGDCMGFPESMADEPALREPHARSHGMLWFRVTSLQESAHRCDLVYDFNMLDNHAYVTEIGLVHNSGKRNGSAAIYLEPWHVDVFEFVALRRNTGSEEERCRDLFLALWIPDLFMERVKAGGDWSLFCPDSAPGLSDVHGAAFVELYERYEREGRAKRVVKAQELWSEIVRSQIETGTPYMLYKDKCQRVNQSNLGIIRSSNLCSEILLYSDPEEYGVCNLASIVLPSYVKTDNAGLRALAAGGSYTYFDFDLLHAVAKKVTRSMDRVIDVNYYSCPETSRSNFRHRPIGIGIQGLADVYMMMRMSFDSDAAMALNRDIAETIYHATLEASVELAMERGAYATFEGSPASRGVLQFDMWGAEPSARYDWPALKARVVAHGLRHSMLIALMPTASTSQIMGYTESFEPITANFMVRRTLAGEFIVVNKYLVRDLMALGLWNKMMKDRILAGNGSIQHIAEIPEDIRALYKTVWEIKQRVLIDQSAARGPFVCHTQSLNLYMEDPDLAKITNMHFYGWRKGLKTGMYYLRTRPRAKTMSFTLDPALLAATAADAAACRRDNPEGCLMCSA